MLNCFTENCFESLVYILDVNSDLMLTINEGIFSKNERERLIDPNGSYANRIYLTK